VQVDPTRTRKVVLEAASVTKGFPGVVALSNVDLSLAEGEVHCLVGENGAGKSTLINILSGNVVPDEGTVRLNGNDVALDPAAARKAGIATIHQEHYLVPYLSVAENVTLGTWPNRHGLVSHRSMHRLARSALGKVAPHIPLSLLARQLSAPEGQLVEIARALSQEARVLIMDEPTTALADEDIEILFSLIRELRSQSMAILYVSHKLEEIFSLADHMSVLRDGRTVASGPATQFDWNSLVSAMVGEDVELYESSTHRPEKVVLEVKNLSRKGVIEDISLNVRSGEILGLAGLAGAGRSELAMCLFGADAIDSGEVKVDGKRVSLRHPSAVVQAGIGLVPEERKQQAIFPQLPVRENISIALLDRLSVGGILRTRQERRLTKRFVDQLDIRTPSIDTRMQGLSGGNQQKTVIARWLARKLRVLILDEPTKGIDIASKAEIHRLIEALAGSGIAIILISSELPELLVMSDRIAVMRRGRLVTVLSKGQANKQTVMAHAAAS
jgi:ABC-type sugar transport system ATPase subunit